MTKCLLHFAVLCHRGKWVHPLCDDLFAQQEFSTDILGKSWNLNPTTNPNGSGGKCGSVSVGIVATDRVKKGQTRTGLRGRCVPTFQVPSTQVPHAQLRAGALPDSSALARVSSALHPEDMSDLLSRGVSRLLQLSPGSAGDLGGVSRQS